MDIKRNLSFLENKKLIQIRINLYSVDLIFENEVCISIAHKFKYFCKNEENTQYWDSDENTSFSINKLLGIAVEKAQAGDLSNLVLEFKNGDSLIIESGQDKYESYIVYEGSDFQVIR